MSQFRKLLVGKAVNYGASKTSATVNTATTPDQLASGAIGIYGIHMATSGSGNQFKLVLITDGGSEAAGKVPVASFVGKEIFVCQGTPGGNLISPPIGVGTNLGIKSIRAKVYTPAVKGVTALGYHPSATSGKLNFPGTVLKGDLLSIGVVNRRSKVSGEREPYANERYSVELAAGDTVYPALVKIVTQIYAVDPLNRMIDYVKILHNGTGAVFTTSATATVTNGSTAVTTSAAHGLTAGDSLSLNGEYFISQAGTAGSAIVLDRPWQGPSQVVANANTLDITVLPTQFGLEITDKDFFSNINVTVQGVLASATITRTTVPLTGSGTITHMQAMEKEFKSMKGTSDLITSYVPKDADYTDTALNGYDLYWMEVQNPNHAGGDPGSVFKVVNYTIVAFPENQADTTNLNQSDFEDILLVIFPTITQIS